MTAAPVHNESGVKAIATNRKAHRDYIVLDKLEAGIELRGTEVKSLRQGNATINESFATVDKSGQVYLHQCHILPYDHGNVHNHDPVRPRRLLLHRKEIKRLHGLMAIKGQTLVPLRMYFKRGRAKVELGLCKGKQTVDKREDIKKRDAGREAERALAYRNRR